MKLSQQKIPLLKFTSLSKKSVKTVIAWKNTFRLFEIKKVAATQKIL